MQIAPVFSKKAQKLCDNYLLKTKFQNLWDLNKIAKFRLFFHSLSFKNVVFFLWIGLLFRLSLIYSSILYMKELIFLAVLIA